MKLECVDWILSQVYWLRPLSAKIKSSKNEYVICNGDKTSCDSSFLLESQVQRNYVHIEQLCAHVSGIIGPKYLLRGVYITWFLDLYIAWIIYMQFLPALFVNVENIDITSNEGWELHIPMTVSLVGRYICLKFLIWTTVVDVRKTFHTEKYTKFEIEKGSEHVKSVKAPKNEEKKSALFNYYSRKNRLEIWLSAKAAFLQP